MQDKLMKDSKILRELKMAYSKSRKNTSERSRNKQKYHEFKALFKKKQRQYQLEERRDREKEDHTNSKGLFDISPKKEHQIILSDKLKKAIKAQFVSEYVSELKTDMQIPNLCAFFGVQFDFKNKHDCTEVVFEKLMKELVKTLNEEQEQMKFTYNKKEDE